MKITFILDKIGISGGVRVVFEYANHLTERGHEVSVIYPLLPTKYKLDGKNLREISKVVWRKLNNLKNDNRDWFDLKANLIQVPSLNGRHIPDADVVVATYWETAYYVKKYDESKGKKFYLIQGYEVWGGSEKKVLATYDFNLKKIVIARWLYEKLSEMGIPRTVLHYIPNGMDFHKYRLINPIEDRPNRVAMLYNSSKYKGSLDGINALKSVKKHFPDFEAVLFGLEPRPKKLPDWMEYVQDPSLEKLVTDVYNRSNIYLCPSWTEGWHLPPAEAMACGCAVVSTNIGGVRDYAIHKKTALLSPVKDPLKLSENIIYLIENEKMRIEIAKAGYSNIKNFSWSKATNKIEKLFENTFNNFS